MLSNGYIQNRINQLLSESIFRSLEVERTSFNLFEILGVSHIELWHSGFIKWILDPRSNLGMGDWPLKRFLSLVVTQGKSNQSKLDLTIGDIESLDLNDMVFECEKYFDIDKVGKGKIDIYGENKDYRIIVENKIKAQEGKDQTKKYYKFATSFMDNKTTILIFLSPDSTQEPQSKQFIKITYQEICDFLLKPLYEILNEGECKYIIRHYISNLGKPLHEGKKYSVMALPNKERCNYLYSEYKDILEELFTHIRTI